MPPETGPENATLRRLRKFVTLGLMQVERIGHAWRITGRGIRIVVTDLSKLQPCDLDP